MVSPIGASLSGLAAASLRVGTAANNIANAQSTSTVKNGERVNEPFVPQEVVQSSDGNGGVRAETRDVLDPAVARFDPQNQQADANGIVKEPNVNLENQIVNIVTGGYDYKANLKAFKVQDELEKSLLDVIA